MKEQKIDFVVLWVDGNDPEWKKQKDHYEKEYSFTPDHTKNDSRYREWDELKYWFRGVEKNAPWVNRIHFVTCGHLPSWLNTSHPKLHIVRHEDIIPQEFLPVFSSHAIEICINRIEGLSERFVYFNDDIFILSLIQDTLFFRNGLPCCKAGLDNISTYSHWVHFYQCVFLQDLHLINKHFNSRAVMKKHWRKFINPVYGYQVNKNTLLYLPWRREHFPGFVPSHFPNPYLKSILDEVWAKEGDALRNTCSHRFRMYDDVNQYLFLMWQICKGQFVPADPDAYGEYLVVNYDTDLICNTILRHHKPILCLNDTNLSEQEFLEKKKRINQAFDTLFPEKSSFET